MADTNGPESVSDKDSQIKKRERVKKGREGSASQLQQSPHPQALLAL